MFERGIQMAAVLLATLGLAPGAVAGTLVVIMHSESAGWRFDSAEKISINGKTKIRLGTAGQTEVRADDYKKLAVEPIGRIALRTHTGGFLAYRSGTDWAPVAPDGASIKGSASYASLWSSARLQLQSDKGSKGADVNVSEVFAILPGSEPSEVAAEFLMDGANFTGFEERMSLLVAVAGTASEPASSKLKLMLLGAMEPAIAQANAGITKYSEIEKGLRFADVSQKAFPADAEQKNARDQLRGRKAWLDRRAAILRAFGAGELWDPFIDKYGEFERFDNSFEQIRELREKSFRESAVFHLTEAKRLHQEKQYLPALREVKLALLRNPSDKEAEGLLETVRFEEARAHAALVKQKPIDVKSAQQNRINRSIAFAESAITERKWEEAESQIAAAEALDKDSPRILLLKAKLFQARKEYPRALETLNNYDRVVNAENDILQGQDLRNKILVELKKDTENRTAEITQAEAVGDYAKATQAARSGVQMNPEDTYFLYHAGFNSAILRNEKDAADFLSRYLKNSLSLNADAKQRADVFGVLPIVSAKPTEPKGKPNWFSGYNSQSFYCPVSLMPNAKPVEVRSSRKQTTTFEWRNGLLASVDTVTAAPGETNSKIYFDYFPNGKAVRRIGTEPFAKEKEEPPAPKLTPEGTVGTGAGTYFALFNHPTLNPYMVERLTGKRVATVVAGNPYFHPFVWTGIHTFIAEYDATGRLRSAKEIQVKGGAPHAFDFEWQGTRLVAITERGTGEYRREMHYAGERITGETVHFQGKSSKIDYKYDGDRLAEAVCENDASIDGRNRRVLFRE